MTRLLRWAACLAMLAGGTETAGRAQAQTYPTLAAEPDPGAFVRRTDGQLSLQGRGLRFGGVNITWLGMRQDGDGPARRPTAYEVRDALATAVALGATIVRLPSLVASDGCALCLETAPGTLSEAAFAQVDQVLETARDLGLKVILPLADGGRECGGPGGTGVICAATARSASRQAFFTDTRMQAAFLARVAAILSHANSISGTVYRDDPTILAWEDCDGCAAAGDPAAVSAWVERLGQAVKAADHRHLFESGAFAGRIDPGAASPVAQALYAPPSVDVIGDHPVLAGDASAIRTGLSRLVDAVGSSGRAYVLDVFGWSPALWHTTADLDGWLADITRDRRIAGGLAGNLEGHADQGGYLPPSPPAGPGVGALYFPGLATAGIDLATMEERSRALRRFDFAMAEVITPPSYMLPPRPEILQVRHGKLTWRGAAGAASYTVERSPDPSAPGAWTTLCEGCATDAAGSWQDPSPPKDPAWYRIMPLNINGHHAVPSQPARGE